MREKEPTLYGKARATSQRDATADLFKCVARRTTSITLEGVSVLFGKRPQQ